MKLWTNTNTLDGLIDEIEITNNKVEAEVALLGSKTIDLNEFPNLKGIFRAGVGRENVPEVAAAQKSIICRFPSEKTVDVIFEETANFTCYMILKAAYANTGTLDPWVKFDRPALWSKKLLVIGTGNIGKRVINKMNTFFTVLTYDALVNKEDELIGMLQQADIVSLHIPGNTANKSFFGKEKLALLKDGTAIINAARGNVVDEDALYNEISAGRLKAIFDVYWQEPYNGKLKGFHPQGFNMTPHVASTCTDFLQGCATDLKKFIMELKHA